MPVSASSFTGAVGDGHQWKLSQLFTLYYPTEVVAKYKARPLRIFFSISDTKVNSCWLSIAEVFGELYVFSLEMKG